MSDNTEKQKNSTRLRAMLSPRVRRGLLIGGVLLIVLVGGWWVWHRTWSGVSQEQVRRAVVTTLQEEAPASFLVTGTLHTSATATVRNEKIFLPDMLDMSLGTTKSTVRLSGTASYGFDVQTLRPEDIQLQEDGIVEVRLPDLAVHAVDPDLSKMEVQTDRGWARLQSSQGRIERDAMRVAEQALRDQAEAHLEQSAQPRVNTARALKKMLTPALQSAGVEEPRFRIRMGAELVMEPSG